jgi:hypothetical protein
MLNTNNNNVTQTNNIKAELNDRSISFGDYRTEIFRRVVVGGDSYKKLNGNGRVMRKLRKLVARFRAFHPLGVTLQRNDILTCEKDLDLSNRRIRLIEHGAIPNNVTRLFLFSNHLTALIPGSIPASVTHLSLMENRVKTLQHGVIPNGVIHLDLMSNKLRTLQPHCIPESVVSLDLVDNLLSELVPGVIPNNLTYLSLRKNRLKHLQAGVIPNNVVTLDLSSNPISLLKPGMIPSTVFYLYIQDCQIKELNPEAIPNGVVELYINDHLESLRFNDIPPSLNYLNLALNPRLGLHEQSVSQFKSVLCALRNRNPDIEIILPDHLR